jgi:hypothetical protein
VFLSFPPIKNFIGSRRQLFLGRSSLLTAYGCNGAAPSLHCLNFSGCAASSSASIRLHFLVLPRSTCILAQKTAGIIYSSKATFIAIGHGPWTFEVVKPSQWCSADILFALKICQRFYLPSLNVSKVLFALKKHHQGSICPPKTLSKFYLPSQDIIIVLYVSLYITLLLAMTVDCDLVL